MESEVRVTKNGAFTHFEAARGLGPVTKGGRDPAR